VKMGGVSPPTVKLKNNAIPRITLKHCSGCL
jgi:hypothetical protein